MDFIVEEIRKIADPTEREKEAIRLLTVFDSPYRGEIPRGRYYNGYRDKTEIDEQIAYGNKFYEEIHALIGDNPVLSRLETVYLRNVEQSRKLAALDHLYDAAAHEFFPYFDDFDAAIKDSCRNAHHNNIFLDDMTFSPDLIGRGGFADVYKARHKDGRVFALKLFRNGDMLGRGMREDRLRVVRDILLNVHVEKELLAREPFLRWQILPDSRQGPWYLMDYLEGKSAQSLLLTKQFRDDDRHRALETYARMLTMLHAEDRCFVDNNWGAVIVGKYRIGICDYDMVGPCVALAKEEHFAWGIKTFAYASREQLMCDPPTKESEAESFARMIDAAYNNGPLHNTPDWDATKALLKKAEKNRSKYPVRRLRKLPQALHELVMPVLNYPKGAAPSAQDFLERIMAL